ncbi:TPA: integrase, partial [Pseudomonas aeruginosa]|nr:integrase [Pseudomonas aeruginosa]
MNDNAQAVRSWAALTAQPGDVRGLHGRDTLIISATQVDGLWVILSRYGDDIWQLDGFTSNVPACQKRLDFSFVPKAFRAVMKAMLYRYLRRGRRGGTRPKGGSMKAIFHDAIPFLRHLEALKLNHIGAVTPMVCAAYVNTCKAYRQNKGKPL